MDAKDEKNGAPPPRKDSAPSSPSKPDEHSQIEGSRRPVELTVRHRELRHPAVAFVAVIAVAAGVVLLVVLLLVHQHEKREAAKEEAERQATWGALEGCLLGAPLEKETGDAVASRFRGVQLTVLATPRDKRATDKEPAWPVRCAGYARALSDEADVRAADGVELRTTMQALGEELSRDTDARADLGKLLEHVWKVAGASHLNAKPSNPASCPKPTLPLLGKDDLMASSGLQGDVPLSSVKIEASPSSNVRFLVTDPALENRAVSCSASGSPTTLVCTPVGAAALAQAPGLSLLGTTDPGTYPWIFAGDRGQLGIYRPSGVLALSGVAAIDASVGPDGSAWLLVPGPDGEVRLQHLPVTGPVPPSEPALDAREVSRTDDVAFFWNWIIVKDGPHGRFPDHLVARYVDANGVLGPAIDIGDVAKSGGDAPTSGARSGAKRFSACRSGSNMAVRIHGASSDEMAFYTGALWTAPVVVPTTGGELSCDKNEAIVTRVSGGDVEQSRCNASGCASTRLSVRQMLAGTDVAPASPTSVAAAELGRRLFVVWDAGPLGGIRMRIAESSDMKATDDTLIADTQGLSGKTEVTGIRAAAHGDSALLFLKTGDGMRILEVGGSGQLTMLRTQG